MIAKVIPDARYLATLRGDMVNWNDRSGQESDRRQKKALRRQQKDNVSARQRGKLATQSYGL